MAERIYGLLGRRLGHSWSVPIHTALGCGGYRLIELEPESLAPFLRREDIGALNVTIPYKRDVIPLCDVVDEAAASIGSVNTIVRRPDGRLYGYNTDIDGFLYMARRHPLCREKGCHPRQRRRVFDSAGRTPAGGRPGDRGDLPLRSGQLRNSQPSR